MTRLMSIKSSSLIESAGIGYRMKRRENFKDRYDPTTMVCFLEISQVIGAH